MSAVTVPAQTQQHGRAAARVPEPDREAEICWRALVMLALEGICPVDNRLEQMLDRLERRS